MNVDVNRRSIGVNFSKGKAEIKLWSPLAREVEVCFDDKAIALEKQETGYWFASTGALDEGALYKFRINKEKEWPDPASLSQPEGVHGASRAIDIQSYKWTDSDWKNFKLQDYILYELHTGTFTADGNFEGIEKKLSYLRELGINAIEIMPVAQFPGNRNWGYDGVYPFAVQENYGGARGLQHLVNACHQNGIAVVLDVVYNHLGPEGNYLGVYGPYTTEKYKTPWGGAINFDDAWCDGVRNYFIENALMWFRDLHIDSQRLDAVHAIKDYRTKQIMQEMMEHVNELMKRTGRTHYLIAELDLNDTRYINSIQQGGYGMDAQWIDEFHHALRATACGESQGYYSDFCGIDHLAKAYRDAYVYDGQFSPHRKKHFGVKTNNEGKQFIVFSQNHDQVGNRMLGERTSQLVNFEMQKLMAAAVMVSPFLPMLFMGEEWSDPHPFLYFVSHTDPELAEAVRRGRTEEFAAFHLEGEAPDPMSEGSFQKSKLQWELLNTEPHKSMLAYYKALISLRKNYASLHTLNRKNLHVEADTENNLITLRRWTDTENILCLMNFSKARQFIMVPSDVKHWELGFDSASPRWKGPGAAPEKISGGEPGSPMLTLQPESILVYADKSNKDKPVQ
jgi:maltooligosyltrehalose trehalohydrolase